MAMDFCDPALCPKKYSISLIALPYTKHLDIHSAPTRRRRKAGVGCTSPLSGACRLPKFFASKAPLPPFRFSAATCN